ncbi:MAG: c-type cytochrome, partial [Planctomycetaceae bacterium]|nr:c-type cytochrome [Planctomycetaceae bacterium]
QIFAWIMCGIIIVLTGMAAYEDSENTAHLAAVDEAHFQAERVMEIAGDPKQMIPTDGAVTILPNDPLAQGPKIFAKNCAGCHHFDGLNGQGDKVMETVDGKEIEAKPVAADLGNFGSREWMKAVLTNYPKHFAPLKNADWYQDIKKKEEAGDEVGEYLQVDEGDMASWMSDYGEDLLESDKQAIDALAEDFFSKAVETDEKSRQFEAPKYDKALAKKGEGLLADASCMDCHGDGGAPDLTGYGSAKWLRQFIDNPGADEFYGEKNQMPAYHGKLSEHEMDMLVRWMTGDYFPTKLNTEELAKMGAQQPAYAGPKEEPKSETETKEEEKTEEE